MSLGRRSSGGMRPEWRNGCGIRRFERPRSPPRPPAKHVRHSRGELVMEGRAPHRDAMGELDLSGLPTVNPQPAIGIRRSPSSLLPPAGVPSGGSSIRPQTHGATSSRDLLVSEKRPLEDWALPSNAAECFQEIFLGNNLRDMRTQSFVYLVSPQRSSSSHSLKSVASSQTGGLGAPCSGFAPANFYRTTSDSTYGSFARLPALPNTTGHLRQPLFLATGVGTRRDP